ncbi:Oxidoreductase-like domain-containing protein [Heracleum sosnowskyi]|uniref:Oxidoreductase-like domain-containing protein n=1 Tax=Heracleum sosnowskyi TaxID=360622 RepID=A0AAD8M5B1_9APIA|nr:Oxidoreductase-like domain-containing protein [Heracleum sosnowskyi]
MIPIYIHNKSQPLVNIKPPLFPKTKHDPHGGATADFTMKHLNFRRITTNHFSNPSRFPRFFCVNNNKIAPHSIMSDKEKNLSQSDTTTSDKNNVNNAGVKEKEVEIPPPPEKPLPGDCCGSGCVRCVWDIYYEELDEYNNLVKNKLSGSSSGKIDNASS